MHCSGGPHDGTLADGTGLKGTHPCQLLLNSIGLALQGAVPPRGHQQLPLSFRRLRSAADVSHTSDFIEGHTNLMRVETICISRG